MPNMTQAALDELIDLHRLITRQRTALDAVRLVVEMTPNNATHYAGSNEQTRTQNLALEIVREVAKLGAV
jgi:hypothetical protein